MRFLGRLVGLVGLMLLLVVAAKNSHIVVLQLFLGHTWSSPLIVFLSLFFIAGVAIGLLLVISPFLSMRRQITSLKHDLHQQEQIHSIQTKDEPDPSI